VRRLGVVGGVAARRVGASAYDGGWSIPLGRDELLWVFDETSFGAGDAPVAPARSQSGLLVSRADWRGAESTARWLGGASGLDRAALIESPIAGAAGPRDAVRVRPMHGLEIGRSGGGQIALYFTCVRPPDGATQTAFTSLGVGVAVGTPGSAPLGVAGQQGDWRLFGADDPQFGAAVLVAGGFDYVYGTRARDGRSELYLARVAHGEVAHRASYRFAAAGGTWSEDLASAAPLFDEVASDLSVSWNEHLRAYLAIYARALSPGREVLARTAARPEGPFSEARLLFRDGDPASDAFLAAAKEHPALAEDQGRVIHVSLMDSRARAPSLWRVELGRW
jgi:hypothetical protein